MKQARISASPSVHFVAVHISVLFAQAPCCKGVEVSVCVYVCVYTHTYTHVVYFCTRWRWVLKFTLRPIYRRCETSGTSCIGDMVDFRVSLDGATKRRISLLALSQLSVVQVVR